MENDIKVSVWCLAYNHAKYIRKALDSFVNQRTNFKYEVIIHDDCSTDGTDLIIKEYQEKYPDIIKPIFEIENKYSSGHDIYVEYCLPKTKGKYIAYCEGDDYWTDENKLQKQYDTLENNDSILMCIHKTRCTNEDDSYNSELYPSPKLNMDESRVIKNEELIKLFFLDTGFFAHVSSYFINKRIFEKNSIYYKINNYFILIRFYF